MKIMLSLLAATCALTLAALPAEIKSAAAAPPKAPSHLSAACKSPENDMVTNDCATQQEAQAEKQLNTTYQLALKSGDAPTQEELRQVQRLWLTYREAECKAEGEGYSSLRVAMEATCVETHDRERTTEIKDLYLR